MQDIRDNLKILNNATLLLHRFSTFDPKMQLSTVLTFLEIAKADIKGETITTKDIETRVGIRSGTSTRNIYYWAEGHKDMRGGHHMVDVHIDRQDMRKRILKLTPKGRFFINQLIEGLKNGETTRK